MNDSELYIDVNRFTKEIDSFRKSINGVSKVSFGIEQMDVNLACVGEMQRALSLFNELLESFVRLSDADAESIYAVIADKIHLDEKLSHMTFSTYMDSLMQETGD